MDIVSLCIFFIKFVSALKVQFARDGFLHSYIQRSPLPSLPQPNNMDYDPYDALLHHVYQQVNQSRSNTVFY